MRGFWCSGDSTSQRIMDVLESFYLRLWKIIVQHKINDKSHCSASINRHAYFQVQQWQGIKEVWTTKNCIRLQLYIHEQQYRKPNTARCQRHRWTAIARCQSRNKVRSSLTQSSDAQQSTFEAFLCGCSASCTQNKHITTLKQSTFLWSHVELSTAADNSMLYTH